MNTSDFEQAIAQHKESIYRICRIYASDPLEPEDLFQEVLLRAWRSFSSFQGKSNVGTWLYRVALNVCMNSKLKLEKSNKHTIQLDSVAFEIVSDDNQDSEKYAALRSCIGTLPDWDRSLIVLFLEELSYREIGDVHGLTENHVAVKMKRIRSKLFGCITNKIER